MRDDWEMEQEKIEYTNTNATEVSPDVKFTENNNMYVLYAVIYTWVYCNVMC